MKWTHKEWLDQATGGDSYRTIGAKTGINYNSIGRDMREKRHLSADRVLAIAAGYGLDPVQALADTGHLPTQPTTTPPTPQQLAQQLRQIAAEVEKLTESNNIFDFPTNVASDIYNDIPDHVAAYGHDDLDQWEENDDTP